MLWALHITLVETAWRVVKEDVQLKCWTDQKWYIPFKLMLYV